MHDHRRAAIHRLSVLTLLFALGATFACRPTWSPDGKQLITPALVDGEVVLARYDLETDRSEVVFGGLGDARVAAATWLADGSGVVTVRGKSATGKVLTVSVGRPDGGAVRTFEVTTETDASNHVMLPPVVVGRALFLGGKRLRKVDLDDGEVLEGDEELGDGEYCLARRGDGVCYVRSIGDEEDGDWELGTVDVATLRTERLFSSPEGDWRVVPMPVFTRDLTRVAIAARRGPSADGTAAILVFSDGELENTLELGPATQRAVGSLCWAPDDVTLYAVVGADDGDNRRGLQLHETSFSGSVTRDTWLVDGVADNEALPAMTFAMQLALAPDGRRGALTTAHLDKLPAEQHGLLLIDLKGEAREVTRLPFPRP